MTIPPALCDAMETYVFKKTQIVKARNRLREEEIAVLEDLIAVFNLFDARKSCNKSEVKTCETDPLQKIWRESDCNKRIDITKLLKTAEYHRGENNGLEPTEN